MYLARSSFEMLYLSYCSFRYSSVFCYGVFAAVVSVSKSPKLAIYLSVKFILLPSLYLVA